MLFWPPKSAFLLLNLVILCGTFVGIVYHTTTLSEMCCPVLESDHFFTECFK